MRKFLCVVAALVGLAGQVLEAAPKAVITGPRTAVAGDRVNLYAVGSVGKLFRWRVWPDYPGQMEVSADGQRCGIPTYPGTYYIQLSVSDDDSIVDAEWVVQVVSQPSPPPTPAPPLPSPKPPAPQPTPPVPPVPPGPGPAPGPAPPAPTPGPTPPPPDPELPAGQFGIANDLFAWAKGVNTPNRAAEAGKLADACEAVAKKAADGGLNGFLRQDTALKVASAMAAESKRALGDSLPAWETACFDKLNARINELYNAGKLTDAGEWAVLLREGAAGLRAAAAAK